MTLLAFGLNYSKKYLGIVFSKVLGGLIMFHTVQLYTLPTLSQSSYPTQQKGLVILKDYIEKNIRFQV